MIEVENSPGSLKGLYSPAVRIEGDGFEIIVDGLGTMRQCPMAQPTQGVGLIRFGMGNYVFVKDNESLFGREIADFLQ